MIFYITLLKSIATCLITNAHYTGIYPLEIIANGGLIGDVIFFAVSGYCLYNVKGNFFSWYGKRLYRCYLPVLIITAIYMLLGFYSLGSHSGLWWYVYPTYYHFVSSIIVLYIPYFVIMKLNFLKNRIPLIMISIFSIYVIIYVFVYDKSYYHIDTVREPFIRFLFMESMLLGAYFKQNDEKFRKKFSWWTPIGFILIFIAYFASKLLFSKFNGLSYFQIVNQLLIFVLLYMAFRMFAGMDGKLEKFPKWLKRFVTFIASITLEIYVVQYVLIDKLRGLAAFPLNWLIVTLSIFVSAVALHYLCVGIMWVVDWILVKLKSLVKKSAKR